MSKTVENDGDSKPLALHCMIHEPSLSGKYLDMSELLKAVIRLLISSDPMGLITKNSASLLKSLEKMTCHMILSFLVAEQSFSNDNNTKSLISGGIKLLCSEFLSNCKHKITLMFVSIELSP